jgi:hypothetical protein
LLGKGGDCHPRKVSERYQAFFCKFVAHDYFPNLFVPLVMTRGLPQQKVIDKVIRDHLVLALLKG